MPPLDLLLILSLLAPVTPAREGRLYWYGQGDGYLGRHHASYWHGQVPEGFPGVVDLEHFGIAASSEYPFGQRLKLTRICACNGVPPERDGSSVEAVVVDRLGVDDERLFDAWPATWLKLADFETGCIKVSVEVIP